MIIGLTGTLAAGKGVVSEILIKKGFNHYSVREFLIKEIIRRGMIVNRDSMVIVANDLRRRFSSGHIAEELYGEAKRKGGDSIIESIRAVGEVETLRNKGDFILIAVDADQRLRYDRIVSRQSVTDKISYEEFVANENREMVSDEPAKQSIARVMEMADFKIINNGTIEEVERDVEQILERIREKAGTIIPRVKKREDYISWDEYFMGVSLLSARRSKDPSTQVGACVVSPDKKIVGVGYNGFPMGCSDDKFPWSREGEFLDTKYPYVVHAEINAILNSIGRDLSGCTLYVALFPCNECAKSIIQSGIKRVVYLSDKYANDKNFMASKPMFDSAGVAYDQLMVVNNKICLEFIKD